MIRRMIRAKNLIYSVANIFEYIGWVLLLLWVVLMSVGTFMRYVLSKPLIFQSDLVSGMLVIFCTFCFGPVFIRGGHIRVDMITRRFSEKMQGWFCVFADVMIIIYTIVIIVSVVDLITSSFALNSKFEVSQIPLLPFQLCIPIGFGLLGLVTFVDLFERLYTLVTGNTIEFEQKGIEKSSGGDCK